MNSFIFTLSFLFFLNIATAVASDDYSDSFRIVTAEFPPFSYIGEDGRPAGIMTEILQEVLKEAAKNTQNQKIKNIEISFFPWKRALQMANEEKNILLYPSGITAERELFLTWLGPRLPRKIWIYGLKSNQPKPFNKKIFKGKLIGITRGYAWSSDVLALGATLDESAEDHSLIRKIITKRVNYVAMDEDLLNHTLKMMSKEDSQINKVHFEKIYPLSLSSERTFALSKNSAPELLKRLGIAYKNIENQDVIQKIYKKYGMTKLQ
ncbi:MAG: transporter substrate-binding domain-containing protein [Pseudobdellovibrio sp.]